MASARVTRIKQASALTILEGLMKALHGTERSLLHQASNLDLFSATQPNEFAEPLSFLLEF